MDRPKQRGAVPLVQVALGYAAKGWPVFPLHSPRRSGGCSCGAVKCDSPAKHPRTEHGLKDATIDPGQVRQWWAKWQDANVGVVTGRGSGLVVVDVDAKNGGGETWGDLLDLHGGIETLTATTGGGGSHWYFQAPPGVRLRNSTGVLGPGIDTRAEGGYVVAPPSRHTSGNAYEWDSELSPAPVPPWLLALWPKEGSSPPATAPTVVGKRILEGERNTQLTSLAGTMRRRGFSEPAITAALLVENQEKGSPPLEYEEIRDIATSVGRYPPATNGTRPRSEAASATEPVLVSLATVQREEVAWLWSGRIPLGKLTILEGDPGVGKSWLSLAIATPVTLGQGLPGAEAVPQGDVLILTAEDGLGDTVRPRLEDMGAAVGHVTVLTGVMRGDGKERHPDLTEDLEALDRALAGGNYRLVIIDPLNAYLGTKLDTHRDAAMRAVLTPLAQLAQRHQVAVLCICHLTKGGRDRAIYRGQGSIAYTAAARVVHLVGVNPDNEQERVIVPVKNNLAPLAPGLAFELREDRFYWRGETFVTAAALLAPDPGTEARLDAEEAVAFLEEALADGQRPVKDVEAEADGLGISKRTLARARKARGVKAHKEGFGKDSCWLCELPPAAKDAKDANNKSLASLGDSVSGDTAKPSEVGILRQPGGLVTGETREWTV